MKKLLMFPGQGSQYSGMGKAWATQFPEARLAFEEGSDGAGLDLKKLCFDGSDSDLRSTEITQPAILTVTTAIFRSLSARVSLKGDRYVFAGHSLGEYSALVTIGVLSLADAARLVHHRGRYMQECVPAGTGSMAALVFKPKTEKTADLAMDFCTKLRVANPGKWISVANFNSPEQIVVSGHKSLIDQIAALAESSPQYAIRKSVELPVSAPFHCALMKPAADRLSDELKSVRWMSGLTDAAYIANIDAQLHTAQPSTGVVSRLTEQITGAVRWVESIQTALNAGIDGAIEIGPGKVLSGLAKRISVPTPAGEKTLTAANIDMVEDFHESLFA